MDSMKEFKTLFLERYLEKNKIGRKSLSRSITKSSSKLNKSNSLNKLSRSLSSSIKQPDDDDYEIYKFFDFLPQQQQQQQQRDKQSASNSNNINSNLVSNAIEINQRQRFSLPNNITENYADTLLDGTSELFIRNYNINTNNNNNSHLSESFNMLNSSDREINSFQEEFYAIHVSKESTTSKDLSHLNSVNEENFLNFESLNLGSSIHQDDNEFFFTQGKYIVKYCYAAKYFNFFIFFSKLR
jgi:hypothetical protein